MNEKQFYACPRKHSENSEKNKKKKIIVYKIRKKTCLKHCLKYRNVFAAVFQRNISDEY